MTHWLTEGFEHLDRGWVWLYTAGTARDTSMRRRLELDSDQWELTALAGTEGWPAGMLATQRALRWLLGVPADLTWRLSLGKQIVARESLTDLIAASLLILGVIAGLPLSIVLTVEGTSFSGHAGSQLLFVFAIGVVLLLCVGGLAVQEFRPVAGTTVALLGILSISLVLWWSVTVPMLGLLCAVGIFYRARRLRR